MKIATLLSRHGLTLPQYRALTIARQTKIVRVSGKWRYRGGSRPLMPDVIARLADRRLVTIDERAEPSTAVTSAEGRALLDELEGRK